MNLILVAFEGRQADVIFYGEYACQKDARTAHYVCNNGVKFKIIANTEYDAANNAGHCINLLTEDKWYLVYKYVAYNSACGAGHCAHNYCNPQRVAKIERFLYADDGKKCEAYGVEKEECVIQSYKMFTEHNNA